ncbi:presqualene diphosphate synthase HpnD [Miltoncostaea marina]|uniref:presqualene diphosphate synthase HpnD n=1 Tax=Miltoncostaea marina TaxID=2843215 RepID=UPI001C3D44A0|nr:presqualene diphosphate synthase HpnD [Miltoncostaea marina]
MTLEEAYGHCRAVARSEARNFYYGFILLPPERRAGIYAAYAFSRRADDSVDDGRDPGARRAAVDAMRGQLDACVAGTPPPDDPVLVALADTIRRFAIPRRHLDALLDGVEMDLTVTSYPDWAALRGYCDRVAGAVGLVSLHVFGFDDPRAPAHAEELGVGLQVVNIMRDVAEDAARGRVYLPADEMRAHGVDAGQLARGVVTPGFRALMAAQAARAHEHIAGGERLLPLLDRRARMCVAMLSGLYREILREIEARQYDVFGPRVALSPARKATLLARRSARALT